MTPVGLAEVHQIALLLRSNEPQQALALALAALASDCPPSLRCDLCQLAGAAATALDDPVMAESLWRRAIDADAAQPGPWFHLGVLLAAQQRDADAQACLRETLIRQPRQADAWDRLGLVLMRSQRALEAEPCHRRAAALEPLDPAPHTHLGFALEAQARHAEALQSHLRALACAPEHPSIHTNLGNVLAFLGRERESEFHHREAIARAPEFATAHCNLGVLLADQRRDGEAEHHLRTAIALRPGYPLARLNLAFLLLALGRWDEGWALHEARYDPALPDHGIPPPPWPIPPWTGDRLAGRSVLVWAEQGFGDQIQFSRFVPLLKAHGAGRVTFVCQRPLESLFRSLQGVDRLVAADVVDNAFTTSDVDLKDHDIWTFPLSLPLHLGTTPEHVPAAIPYLRGSGASGEDGEDGGQRNFRVGIVWRGNPRHHNDADRSLPGLTTLAPLWSVPGVRFTSLQTGAAAGEARHPPAGQPLEPFDPHDFADTARVLASLDLFIGVDTSGIHLAGALGLPCWVLLPHHRTDWRWLRDRDESPWYPGRMRLFRQPRRGDWASAIEQVTEALRGLAAGRQALQGLALG